MSTFSNNKRANALGRIAVACMAICVSAVTFAQNSDPAAEAIRVSLTDKYPNTKFGKIERTPMAGVWEVWMGSNVAYVTDDIRYFIFGHLYDMQTQTDLTAGNKAAVAAQKKEAPQASIHFQDLPLKNAIKTVRGNGKREMAVFSDPDCPYCKQLEASLAKLDNVTIYTFLYPIASLHQSAATRAEEIWCAKDRTAAWRDYMLQGKKARSARCLTPIADNIALANRAGILGTPYVFFSNGQKTAGAMDTATLESYLSGK